MEPESRRLYRFGTFLLNVRDRVLLKDGLPVALTPKSFDVLVLLVENSGHLVPKTRLMSEVWCDAFVEENTINRSVSVIRKVLGETGYIETVPKHGYRFVADVVGVDGAENAIIVEKYVSTRILTEKSVSETHALEGDGLRTDLASPPAANLYSSRWSWLRDNRRPLAVVALLVVTLLTLALVRTRRGSSPTMRVSRVAVLPFRVLNPRTEDAHQGVALADILITRLSGIKALTVRPTSAIMSFADRTEDPIGVGRQLNVEAVLEGAIYRAGDKVRVTAQLLRVSDQSSIWAAQFEEPSQDLLRLHQSIALQVVEALTVELAGDERLSLTKRFTESSDAYHLYLRGRVQWNRRDNEGLTEADHLFRNAIEKDPSFALAYVGLADKCVLDTDPGEASALLSKALDLDPNLAEAYATRGFLHTFHKWDWKQAENDFKRAIDLNPGYPTARQWYATLLMIQGRLDEAKKELQFALTANPTSYNLMTDLGEAHYFAHEYGQARDYCEKALAINPDFIFAHERLADIYFRIDDYERAVEHMWAFGTLLSRQPYQSTEPRSEGESSRDRFLAIYRQALSRGGRAAFWRQRIEELRAELALNVNRNGNRYLAIAQAYLQTGESRTSLSYIEKAYQERAFLLPFMNSDPAYDPLRNEPEFQAILRRMNLAN